MWLAPVPVIEIIEGSTDMMPARRIIEFTTIAMWTSVGLGQVSYELVRKIENPQGAVEGSGDEFGISIAQVGKNFVVGAYRDDTGASNAGAAYVFDAEGSLLTTIHNPTPSIDDWFGFEVRAVGDKIVIAARNDDTSGVATGSVYLYDQQGTLIKRIANPTPEFGDEFGHRIYGIGEKILVTALEDDSQGPNAGAAYLFDQSGNFLQEFYSPRPQANAQFGRTVSVIDENRFVISAYTEQVNGLSNVGAAYLFDIDGNLLQTFENPDPDTDDYFGVGIATVGDSHVVLGAVENRPSAVTGGTAYLYDIDGNLTQTIPNPTGEVQDWFGRTMMGVGDDKFVIGAVFDNTVGERSGAAYLYNTTGELLQEFFPPEPVTDGHFSLDLATLDELILIGSHFDGGGFTGPGAVYVYAPVLPLLGDYNADQVVDQADLDLVLLNWGSDGSTPPDGWVRNLPRSFIDQQELDNVLLNWGQTTTAARSLNQIPEPTSSGLGMLTIGVILYREFLRKGKRCPWPGLARHEIIDESEAGTYPCVPRESLRPARFWGLTNWPR